MESEPWSTTEIVQDLLDDYYADDGTTAHIFVIPADIAANIEESRQDPDEVMDILRTMFIYSISSCVLASILILIFAGLHWCYVNFECPELPERLRQQRERRAMRRAMRLTRLETWVPGTSRSRFGTQSCVICLEDFRQNDVVRKLRCGHAFHVQCIDRWIIKAKAACPICNNKLVPSEPGRRVAGPSQASALNVTPSPENIAETVLLLDMEQPVSRETWTPASPNDEIQENGAGPEQDDLLSVLVHNSNHENAPTVKTGNRISEAVLEADEVNNS